MIRLVVVDDDASIRAAVRARIEQGDATRYEVVGEAASVAEALAVCREKRPDIILLDLELPDGSGADLLREIRAESPQTIAFVITVFGDDTHVFEALRAGAVGYLLKDDIPARLLSSLDDLVAGGAPMTPAVARRVLQSFHAPPGAPARADEVKAPLTDRETDVTRLLALGATYDEIARALSISANTVRTYIRSIYDKLHVTSRTEAAVKAIRLGLVKER